MSWDHYLWWVTVLTGSVAAALSLFATVIDHKQVEWPTRIQRFRMHIASYVFLTVSILGFVLRGLLGPS
jgi:hypothetical protein